MNDEHEHAFSDPEYLRDPRGAILIAACGPALHGCDGIYRGYGPLVRALCGGSNLPHGRTPADDSLRRQIMGLATTGIRIPRVTLAKIRASIERPGVGAWLWELQQAGGLLSLMPLGREKIGL
jgi:hypothetical protein